MRMRILLPPSETKNLGTADKSLEFESLSFSELDSSRKKLFAELVKVSKRRDGCERLGIPPTLSHQLDLNRNILHAPTAPAIEIYNGVLFDSLDYKSLSAAVKTKANHSLVIFSAAFGLLTAVDQIPSYRLSASAKIFANTTLNSFWKKSTAAIHFSQEVVVDMRSGMYESFWTPLNFENYLVLKIVDVDKKSGKKLAVSHFNKATKGLIARDLLQSKSKVNNADAVINALSAKGWRLGEVSIDKFNRTTYEVFMRQIPV